ncbi:prepilin-type N-terminal cleavage/methylation domain-containing protein [Lysinibacillus sp. NPDC093688]|uniref:prepilin-type N-terminal cleavage/methylation domain-containing protein n=1 Tax=Lysinibacillus sp. NPDC093688 TaxID=3390577 RepID=UPI003CFD7949
MFKKIMNKKLLKNQKGLTLIELLAVIVILAIIAAIAIPAIGNIIENSRYNAAKSDAINVINAANLYFTDEGSKDGEEVDFKTLKTNKYLDNAGKFEDKDAEGIVKKVAGGNTLSGKVKYSGEKTVNFNAATITVINDDKQKGSAPGDKDIPKK